MSAHSPDSWSFTNTEAVMCIALTRTKPSWMPLVRTCSATSSVTSMISWRDFVLNQRYCVWDIIYAPLERGSGNAERGTEGAGARMACSAFHVPRCQRVELSH